MTTIVAPPWEEQPTGGGIVAASDLPLPDVWAPLSDSLRMITGYGRDVLVGSDVVASMVNFSRSTTATYIGKDDQLKTAAVNEPRFEKEGLLIEGQSTNLITTQSFSSSSEITVTPNQPSPDGANNAQKIESISNPTLIKNVIATASVLTASWFFKMDGNGALDVVIRNGTTNTNLMSTTITVTNGVATAANPSLSKLIPIKDGWYRHSFTQGTGIAVGNTIMVYFGLAGAPTPGRTFTLFGLQAEALPFASSYIPTAGAAVTRASDMCWIPNALNVTPDYGDLTIAMEVRRNLAIPSSLFPRAIQISDRQLVVADSVRIMARGGGAEQVSISGAAPGTRELIAATVKGDTIACFLNGTKATLPHTPILPVSNGTSCFIGSNNGLAGLFGHVRNVRIWQRTLSDEQIKAAA